MVGLGMVGNDHVDLGGIDDRTDAREHFVGEALLDCIDESDLFIEDQVGVVRRALSVS